MSTSYDRSGFRGKAALAPKPVAPSGAFSLSSVFNLQLGTPPKRPDAVPELGYGIAPISALRLGKGPIRSLAP